jgi:hypothetical protein
MPQVSAELPQELLTLIDDAARDLHKSREEIVQRALEHYARHVAEVMTTVDDGRADRRVTADWAAAKQVFQETKCPYDECPFVGECPPELCPL